MIRPLRLAVPAALVLAGAVAALAWELVLSRGRTPAIVDERGAVVPGSIAALEPVRLGGVEQWILVRGRDRAKPVLLFLHGGPGMPAMFLAHAWQRALEQDFVVVHWDRRGAGKSFHAGDAGPPSVRRTLDDLHELTALLRARFGGRRIWLVGHSWGSYLGLLAVRERPGDYVAFVGTGQMAGTDAEVWAARGAALRAAAAADRDEALLARLARPDGAISEDDLFRHGGELHAARGFWPLLAAGLRAPEYDLEDVWNVKRGAERVGREMRHDVDPRPGDGEVRGVRVPVFFLLGRHDLNTPSALAAAYLPRLGAPLGRVVWLERSAHFPFFEEPEAFRAALLRARAEAERFWRASGGDPAR